MKLPLIVGTLCVLIVLGVGMYVTNFTVYLGSDPNACNNCHTMDAAYESWYHGGHRMSVTCMECHAPHDVIPKYAFKAYSGMRDVLAFSTGLIPEELRATPLTKDIVQSNCIRCHAETVSMIGDGQPDANRYCFSCHQRVAHGERGFSMLVHQDGVMYPGSQESSK